MNDHLETDLYIKYLLGVIKLRSDYQLFLNNKKNLLLVEGQTDSTFISHYLNGKTDAVIVGDGYLDIKGRKQSVANCKNIIVSTVKSITRSETSLSMKINPEIVKGMIDKDNDEESIYADVKNLFVTDTHDLETMLISSDPDLFAKIEECNILDEDIERAIFMAYQIGYVRKYLNKVLTVKLSFKNISPGRNIIDYAAFFSNDKLNIGEIIDYLNSGPYYYILKSKVESIKESVIWSEDFRHVTNSEGVWNEDMYEFQERFTYELWNVINGHDVLSLLRFVNPSTEKAFGGYTFRYFENAIIKAFDYSKYKKCEMYKRMKEAELIL